MRLIDAEAFIENLERFLPGIHQTYLAAAVMRIVKEVIDKQPTIEAKPVVHAHWENEHLNRYGHLCHCCSNCGFSASHKDKNLCANCGAQMDEPFPQAHENDMKGE